MVYALELLVLILLVLRVTTSTNGATSTSACNDVVAVISGPCNGAVAEPFCRVAPYPIEGVSLTIDAVPFAWSRFTFTPATTYKT